MSASFYLLDGVFISATEPGLFPSNRGFRYGEGLFETMRYQHGRIALWHYHWERLRAGMALLGLEPPVHWGPEQILEKCLQLVRKNKCGTAARLRLTVCPGEGGLWETPRPAFRWVVECWKAEPLLHLHENGLDLGVFDGGYKSCDPLSNLKSANYLLYAQAARYAKTQHWNECLVLNQHNRIADATIANLFYVKAGAFFAAAPRGGGAAGGMRRRLPQADDGGS
ncbi:MAG TPA: aminotransferase class IV, partial [Lacibacter sp.]|nr:aminotransferase class IV [Lacibacter sp.]